jgi:hypothetical protein
MLIINKCLSLSFVTLEPATRLSWRSGKLELDLSLEERDRRMSEEGKKHQDCEKGKATARVHIHRPLSVTFIGHGMQ